MDLTDRPADAAAPHQLPPPERAGDDLLARALRRARWTVFWERLWPALASIATVVGLFLAVSWLGLWLWLPPTGRAIGLGIFFLLAAAAFAPALALRAPSRIDGLRRLDRQSRFAPPAAHRHGRRDRGADSGLLFARTLARPCRARLTRDQDAQSRNTDA